MNEAEARATAKRTDVPPFPDQTKLAVWFFIGSEVILFTTLILTFVASRLTHAEEYGGFRSHLSIPLIGINTFVLVLSSYFVVRALQAATLSQNSSMIRNLLMVLALGSLFIGGQAYEWSQLFGEGIRLDNAFGTSFFIVTGIHGTHVLIGLAWASIVLLFGLGDLHQNHRRAVEFFGLYWHFVDIVWIVLFSVIYLL